MILNDQDVRPSTSLTKMFAEKCLQKNDSMTMFKMPFV